MLDNEFGVLESPRNDELTTNQPDALVTDGGVAWSDLTGFQRDILIAIAQLDERSNGLEINEQVSKLRGETINHGRLYPNLEQLINHSLIFKGELNKRSNYYQLTWIAVDLIIKQANRLDEAAAAAMGEDNPIVTDGGEEIDRRQNISRLREALKQIQIVREELETEEEALAEFLERSVEESVDYAAEFLERKSEEEETIVTDGGADT